MGAGFSTGSKNRGGILRKSSPPLGGGQLGGDDKSWVGTLGGDGKNRVGILGGDDKNRVGTEKRAIALKNDW